MFDLSNGQIVRRLNYYLKNDLWVKCLDSSLIDDLFLLTRKIDYPWLVQLLQEEGVQVPSQYAEYLDYKIPTLKEADAGFIDQQSEYPNFELQAYIADDPRALIRLLCAYFYTHKLDEYFEFLEFDFDNINLNTRLDDFLFKWYLSSDNVTDISDYANLNKYDGIYLICDVTGLGTVEFHKNDKQFYKIKTINRSLFYIPDLDRWIICVNHFINEINRAY